MHGSTPPPLPYQSPYGPPPLPPHGNPAKQFFIGMGIGAALSLLVWFLLFHVFVKTASFEALQALMVILPLLKLVVGIVYLCLPGKRMIGGGVLTSIAIGLLIFFGMCVSGLTMNQK